MNSGPESKPTRFAAFRNWLSVAGLVIVLGACFSFILLFILDTVAHFSNPYVGVLTYLVTPMFILLGLACLVIGAWWAKRKMRQAGIAAAPRLQIDLGRPRDRRILFFFLGGTALFLLLAAMGSYQTYHFTESTTFCGQACHTVMKPEFVTYQHGSHARVGCTECHIGPGATWFVRSKLSGTYQVYATIAKKYPKPIPTPVANLRPAQETCEQCHWPKKFVGNLDRTYSYFLAEETNTFWSIRMLMRVGGADPSHGPVGGIHWHMNVGNKVQYLPADPSRLKIPFVRTINAQGVVTEYRTKDFTNAVDPAALRTMDCMDCHNRPAHVYKSPNDAVNLAMLLGRIDPQLPWIKTNAVYVLTQDYATETEAREKIATFLAGKYPNQPSVRAAIEAVQQIYSDNFFPEMKASWKAYPNHIGHKDWPGCFRCHDDKHKTPDGKQAIRGNECNICHVILAQGTGKDLEKLDANGQKFNHPGGDYDGPCNDCHTGGL